MRSYELSPCLLRRLRCHAGRECEDGYWWRAVSDEAEVWRNCRCCAGITPATKAYHKSKSRQDMQRCKPHDKLQAPDRNASLYITPQSASCTLTSLSKDSPHINRRLWATAAHNLSKATQLRRPRAHTRRSSQRSTSSCRTRKASRSRSPRRVIRQSKSPSCAVS